MTATLDHPATGTTSTGSTVHLEPGTTIGVNVNARGESVFLKAAGYELTARQIVFVLAGHLTRFGDTLDIRQVDPFTAIDAFMRFDTGARGDLTSWTTGRTPADVATVLARAEAIARAYFGTWFPPIPW
ncbi:hypothetical protein ACQEVB_32785 [Pseudonocardia sp. CA-107938]|uniref:hypothetical protein n=1 Tax=Pseudonocardia sp. CA-107938 TaxID=3240021 RepID=UPI003D93F7DD